MSTWWMLPGSCCQLFRGWYRTSHRICVSGYFTSVVVMSTLTADFLIYVSVCTAGFYEAAVCLCYIVQCQHPGTAYLHNFMYCNISVKMDCWSVVWKKMYHPDCGNQFLYNMIFVFAFFQLNAIIYLSIFCALTTVCHIPPKGNVFHWPKPSICTFALTQHIRPPVSFRRCLTECAEQSTGPRLATEYHWSFG